MTERELRDLIAAVKTGELSRRVFVRRMIGLGLTAPFAGMLLSRAGVAQAAAKFEYKPTKAGGGGPLKTLFWQAPTLLNPHFAIGTKDQEGSRIFYEPLAGWDADGNLVPMLAAEIPETENGGISPDGKTVTWKLKKDVQWHDGRPFTADDVVFNWEYAADPATAARAVIQTGEYDYAWNMQVEDEILLRLEDGGKARGRAEITPGGNIEHIQVNSTDPWTEVDGERSSAKTKHPLFSDPAVKQALKLLVDRDSVEKHIYGRTGTATGNFINNPPKFISKNTHWEFNVDKANQLLEQAGWKKGSDGIRAKDGKKLKLVYQTSINQPRQKTQAIVKQACQKAGIDVELKSVTSSVYFSSDVANPDTYSKFYCDIQMYTTTMGEPDPTQFMRQFLSSEISSKENKWQGRNITRWRNEEYDKAYTAAEGELDPVKRAALFIKMNDLVVGEPNVIPVMYRPRVSAISQKLKTHLSGWDNDLWDVRNWYRET